MATLLLLTGCDQDMADQPKYEPLEASAFFANGDASRPLVEGTVARGHLQTDTLFYTGKVDGQPAEVFPQPVTRAMLERGRQRYDIFCSACHDRIGSGQGAVVQRGFPKPPSLNIERLRTAPPGYIFDTITNGFGRMPSHAAQIPPADRWAIVAYVRALQLSQHAERDVLSQQDLKQLDEKK